MSQVYKKRPDLILLFVAAALLSVGLLMVFSASPTWAMRVGDSYYYVKRHLAALAVGIAGMYLGYRMDLPVLSQRCNQIFGAAVILLMIVLVPGIGMGIGGANRWISMGFFSFQPGELAKVALIIFLAGRFSADTLSKPLVPLLCSAACALLVVMEPDIGTAVIICIITFAMFYFAGAKKEYLASMVAVSATVVFFLSVMKPYRFRRLLAYIDPWSDPQGVGFHIIQSLVAVGSGGLFGLGLGASKQKFFYLPQNYTDFIFAIFCEEMGLIGAIGVVLLFFFFIGRGVSIIRNAPDPFSMLLASGIVAWVSSQAMLNISVVLGILPTTGIPLPFISYGGTSIVSLLFGVGLLLNISRFRRTEI